MNPAVNPLATNPCGTNQFWCNQMYEWTGNEAAARLANLLLGQIGVVLLIIMGGFIFRFLAHRLINRVVARAEKGMLPGRLSTLGVGSTTLGEAMSALEGDYAERRVARARTMGSLMKSIATIFIFTIVVLMCLSELNIDIAPLLASAGIAGIALGFGAQSLVKDFLNGLFMMFEDQYGVGDIVDLGEAVGVVEAVSPRVTRVRDYSGTVWYVRNGEILRVGNSNQNWARVNVDVAVQVRLGSRQSQERARRRGRRDVDGRRPERAPHREARSRGSRGGCWKHPHRPRGPQDRADRATSDRPALPRAG